MKKYLCGIAAVACLAGTPLYAQETTDAEQEILTYKERQRLERSEKLAKEREELSKVSRFKRKAIERAEERERKYQERLKEREEKLSRFQKKPNKRLRKELKKSKKNSIELTSVNKDNQINQIFVFFCYLFKEVCLLKKDFFKEMNKK